MRTFARFMHWLSKPTFSWIDVLLFAAIAPLWTMTTWHWALGLAIVGACISLWCQHASERLARDL